jgi:integrase
MSEQMNLPDLSFANVEYSPRETPWNLNLLFYSGAASKRPKVAISMIQAGKLGAPVLERSELLEALHAEILGNLETGGARSTADFQIRCLRQLFDFAERKSLPLNLSGIVGTYVVWTDSLYHRVQLKKTGSKAQDPSDGSPISQKSAFTYGSTVSKLLDCLLEAHSSVLELTRLRHANRRKSPLGVEADKQILAETFAFGHMLQDICDGLPLDLLSKPTFPLTLKFRSGQEVSRAAAKAINSTAPSLGIAWVLINLRIEAEMYMFIGQTGMNLAQASGLQLRNFFFLSHLSGYQVKDYKARRRGEVLFEIFKDYKSHFERYLQWRKALFPDSDLLFPFVGFHDTRQSKRANGARLKLLCAQLKVSYVSPRTLRNTRINWLLRRSADPELTAEMSQHVPETLLSVYERPSLQRAMVETMRFWSTADPNIAAAESVGPGHCSGRPVTSQEIPRGAPEPDCVKAAGCLWCENHRDVDSQDHIWALTSFKQLKVLEVSRYRQAKSDDTILPSQLAVERINEKLRWYSISSKVREEWVTEAEVRVEEGEYHSSFASEIHALEGVE